MSERDTALTPAAEKGDVEAEARRWIERCDKKGALTAAERRTLLFARALLSSPRVEGDARLFIENVASCSEDDRVGVLKVLAERLLETGSLSPQGG